MMTTVNATEWPTVVVEASGLDLPPGVFPCRVAMNAPEGGTYIMHLDRVRYGHSGEVECAEYLPLAVGPMRLTILND